jgi:hypothetical protein
VSAQHTPGPWTVKDGKWIKKGKIYIAETFLFVDSNMVEAPQSANAEFIALACNNFDDLLEALRMAAQQPFDSTSFVGFSDEHIAYIKKGWHLALNAVHASVRAAIARAEGKS